MGRDNRREDDSIQSFKFLWAAYERKYWFWEVVEMGRKLILAGVMVVVVEGSTLQIAIGLLVCFLSFGGYTAWQPYEEQSDDNLQMFCQLQLFSTLLCGLLLKVNRRVTSSAALASAEANDDETEAIGIFLIVSSVSVAVACVVMGIMDAVKEFCPRRRGVEAGAKVTPNVLMGALTQYVEKEGGIEDEVEMLRRQLAAKDAEIERLKMNA